MNKNRLIVWLQQIRAPFLILAIVLVFIGVAMAKYDGVFHWMHAVLLFIGVVQTHIAVNLFNELSDFQTGIDSNTHRTPFSGGSGMMQTQKTTPRSVRIAAYANMLMAGAIGLYFCMVSSWWILVFMITGGSAIRFYTSHLAKWMVGEAVAGLTLGSAVVMGVYLALTGTLDFHVVLLSIPPGILTTQLLFLNEFPDADVDREGGRRHWVIQLGRARSAMLYCVLMGVCFLIILSFPWIARFPMTILIGLGTLPVAIKSCLGAIQFHSDFEKLIPSMGMNVMVVLITDVLLGVGLLLG